MYKERSLDPAHWTRLWATLGLSVAGALAGAVVGLALTVLGKIVTGAPPADAANYLWNARVFGVMGAVLGPSVTWAALRRVPLWRTAAEPLAGAVVGAGIGVLLGSPAAFLMLTPLGAALAVARLERAHRPAEPLLVPAPDSADRLPGRNWQGGVRPLVTFPTHCNEGLPLRSPAFGTIRSDRAQKESAGFMDYPEFAESIRQATLQAALDAYEDAGIQGLCEEGRWEAAISAIKSLDLTRLMPWPASSDEGEA